MSKKQQFKGLKFNYSINGKGLKSKYKTIEVSCGDSAEVKI